jgi:hypothetical protein
MGRGNSKTLGQQALAAARRTGAQQPANSLRIRKLIFRNDALDILQFALDAVSKASICLNGHALDDGVDHRRISYSTTLRPLGPVQNLFIELIRK